ncbi:MAG: ankyrin repeat domain-containing protein [Alcanivoracaceae bacterium]|nr:ankyrin repeat domain-containing protein [Alcanivoracaceae bacterium]
MRNWWWLLCCLPGMAAAEDNLLDVVCQGSEAIRAALVAGAPADVETGRGENALHRLFRCGVAANDPAFDQAVRLLLDAEVPLDALDAQGRTPLHAALESVSEQDTSVNLYTDGARLLLARGANPQSADNAGTQPLHLAAAEPRGDVTQLLLDLGADPAATDNAGYTPLWYALAADNNLATFTLLWQQQADTLDAEQIEQLATLAANRQRHDMLNLLLQQQPQLVLPTPAMTRTLEHALWQGSALPTLERLVAAGADATSLQASASRDLAWRLAMLGRESALAWLVAQGWDPNQPGADGYPSLYFADANATALLLAQGADPNVAVPAGAGTLLVPTATPPTHYGLDTAPRGQARSAALLAAGYQPGHDGQGRSDLMLAVQTGDLWLVRRLLEHQPPDRDAAHALLGDALAQGRLPLLQTLLRALPREALDASVVSDYLRSGAPDPLLVEALLVAGASLAPAASGEEPPLLLAARLQQWPVVEKMLAYGADTSVLNAQGCSLRCYEWSMPETLQQQLAPTDKHAWQMPTLDQRPSGFFALALTPLLLLWLLELGWRLARHQPLWKPSLWMAASALTAILVGAALFYQCDPCVIDNDARQLALTAAVGVITWSLKLARRQRRAPQ